MAASFNVPFCLYKQDDKSDKVWGVAEVEGRIIVFWGRRTGKMQFKDHGEKDSKLIASCHQAAIKKKEKGYKPMFKAEMDIWLEEKDLRRQLFDAKMLNKVH